jgi:hypothetical protein
MSSYKGQFCFAERTIKIYEQTNKDGYEFTSVLGAILNVLSVVCDDCGTASKAFEEACGEWLVKPRTNVTRLLEVCQQKTEGKTTTANVIRKSMVTLSKALTHKTKESFRDVHNEFGEIEYIVLGHDNDNKFTQTQLQDTLKMLGEVVKIAIAKMT